MADCLQFSPHEWNAYLCSKCFQERKDHQLSSTYQASDFTLTVHYETQRIQ